MKLKKKKNRVQIINSESDFKLQVQLNNIIDYINAFDIDHQSFKS